MKFSYLVIKLKKIKYIIRYQDRGAICWRDAHIYGK